MRREAVLCCRRAAGDAHEPWRLPHCVRRRVLVQLQEAQRDARQAGLCPSQGSVQHQGTRGAGL